MPPSMPWLAGLSEMDGLSLTMLSLALAPAVLFVWGAIGARRTLDCFVLVVFYGLAALAVAAATNLIVFYVAWEILCLCCWGLGRWGTSLVGKQGIPANTATALGSFAMFVVIVLLARDSQSLAMEGLRTNNPEWVRNLLLLSCFLKTWGVLGQVWQPIEGRAFAVSQGILASGGILVVGLYPLLRFFRAAVEWPVAWQPAAVWTGAAVGLVMAVAALGTTGASGSAGKQSTPYRALSYGAWSYFGWSVALMALQRGALETGWVLWLGAGALGFGSLFLAVELMAGSDSASAGSLPTWSRMVGIVGCLVAAVAILGVPPLVGFQARMLLSLSLFDPQQGWRALAFAAGALLTFLYLCRLIGTVRGTQEAGSPRWPVFLALPVLAGVAALAWFSTEPLRFTHLVTTLAGQGG